MKRGLARLLFLITFIFVGTISSSFAGQFDAGNAALFKEISDFATGGTEYASYNQAQRNELIREMATLPTFAQTFPQNQNHVEAYQIALLDNFRQQMIAPLASSLVGNLRDVPDLYARVLSAKSVDISTGMLGFSSFFNNAAGGAGPILTGASAQAGTQAVLANSANKGACILAFGTPFSIGACITDAVEWIIKSVFLEIAGFLLWAAANLFNYAIQIGILNFSQWAPDTLYPIWIIIRQIVSLIIVFIGLYLGLLYILGQQDGFEKYIPWVVMFALFVNFSYPLARTAVDISNIVSLKIYASAVGGNALTAKAGDQNTAGALIMTKLGLGGLVASSVDKTSSEVGMLKSVSGIPGSLLVVVYVLYAAYIFFAITWLIVARTAALVFIIIASPLLFVDSVLPMLGNKAKELRKIFFEQLAVGPIFMIMLALTLKFLTVFSAAMNNANNAALAGNETISTFFNILMMLIMLHIMLKITKSTSGAFGKEATEWMGKVGGFGLGVATGGTGMLARETIGRGAAKVRDLDWVKNNPNSFVARRTYDLTNSVAKSTFDLRNSKVVAKGAGMAGMDKGMVGIGMGMGTKANYSQSREERDSRKIKDVQERAARIKTKYERDVIKDGKVDKRKGDVNQEMVDKRDAYLESTQGSVFRTKEQKEKIADSHIDEKGGEIMSAYKKVPKKEQKAYADKLRADLEELKKRDPNIREMKTQALARSIFDIEKEEKEFQETFDKEVADALYKYKAKSGEDQKKFLSNLSENVSNAVRSQLTSNTISQFDTTLVKQGLANNPKGESSPFGNGSEQATASPSVDINLDEPFNVEENIQTMTFAQKAAAKRKAALATAAAQARQEMGSSTPTYTSPVFPVTPTPPTTPVPPTAPAGAALPTPQAPANDTRVAQAA